MNNDYLAHYGVKGMKWGVRRELGKRARLGATAGRMAAKYGRLAEKNRYNENERKGYAQLSKQYAGLQRKLYKGMSAKDIQQGKRAFTKGAVASVLLSPVIGGAIVGGAEGARQAKLLDMLAEQENSKHSR